MIIDGKTIFSCDFENDKFDFKNLEYINAETASIDRYLQSMDVLVMRRRFKSLSYHFKVVDK